MGNSTRPQSRLDRESTNSAQLLGQADRDARRLIGNSQQQITTAQSTAEAAGSSASTASTSASAAQATANTAITNAATAQSTADGKVALLTDLTIATDADATFTAGAVSNSLIFHTGTLTADRAITLAAATDKWQARFVRTGAGAFNLSIGGLKNLTTGTWADVYYNGSAWVLMASGTL